MTVKSGIISEKKTAYCIPGAFPFAKIKKAASWIAHTYYKGASRYFKGQFQQFPIKLKDKKEGLLDGQKWLPVDHKSTNIFYDFYRNAPYVWKMDSLKGPFIYYYDYETRSFDQNGESIFDKNFWDKNLKGHFSSQINYRNMLRRDEKGRYYLAVNISSKFYFFYSDGSKKLIHNIRKKENGRVSAFIINNETGSYLVKTAKKNIWLYQKEQDSWEKLRPPGLKRYGKDYKKANLSFHNFYTQNLAGKIALYTLWKVNEKGFEKMFLFAEHSLEDYTKTVQTFLFKEDKTINNIVKDKAGTFWYSNSNKVIRLFPDQLFIPSGFQNTPYELWSIVQATDKKNVARFL